MQNYDRVKKITAIVLCGSFALGTVAGVLCADVLGAEYRAELGKEIVSRVAGEGVSYSAVVLGCLWPVFAAVAAGLTVYCRGVYPLLFFSRGVSFSYGVSVVYAGFSGIEGPVVALGLIAPKNLLLASGLLVLCMDAYAKTLGGKRSPRGEQCYAPDPAFYKRSVAAFLLALCAAGCAVHLSPSVCGLVV